jgi:hypothetical protein
MFSPLLPHKVNHRLSTLPIGDFFDLVHVLSIGQHGMIGPSEMSLRPQGRPYMHCHQACDPLSG